MDVESPEPFAGSKQARVLPFQRLGLLSADRPFQLHGPRRLLRHRRGTDRVLRGGAPHDSDK
ncbi:MAG: hypothetical protein A2105_02685 [Omnitrophica WOR_2 bacterium GWF2_63_9]|nr:MAG: hypothetical protein A2105_02685 [Omnitrophica WOR_2 bacterium GWF2_63_9]